jgi:hypothetical protein
VPNIYWRHVLNSIRGKKRLLQGDSFIYVNIEGDEKKYKIEDVLDKPFML